MARSQPFVAEGVGHMTHAAHGIDKPGIEPHAGPPPARVFTLAGSPPRGIAADVGERPAHRPAATRFLRVLHLDQGQQPVPLRRNIDLAGPRSACAGREWSSHWPQAPVRRGPHRRSRRAAPALPRTALRCVDYRLAARGCRLALNRRRCAHDACGCYLWLYIAQPDKGGNRETSERAARRPMGLPARRGYADLNQGDRAMYACGTK